MFDQISRYHGIANLVHKINHHREFPGGLVVKMWHFHHCGLSSIPGLGTELSSSHCMLWQKKKKNKRHKELYRVLSSNMIIFSWVTLLAMRFFLLKNSFVEAFLLWLSGNKLD